MKRAIANTLVAMAMVMLIGTAAHAISAPHNYSCDFCHSAHVDLGLKGYNNICLYCHSPGSGYGGAAIKSFKLGDLANPFKTYTGSVPPGAVQSAHNWSATDNQPAAGSQPPTSTLLNTPVAIKGTIACNRCHAIHAGPTDPNRSRPFLRAKMDSDDMCLDCHKPRNTRNHMTGTHPINFTYTSATSKAKLKPSEYNSTPVNANPANPTSAMKLVNGKILCSTCHGVHYTDSRSGTFDNHSSSVLGNLSTSSGLLLRTNMRGATAASTNICTNCHAKNNHNGTSKQQNVQCADCHAGHVDVADGTAPNVFLVRRYMNISTAYGAVRNKKVMFQYSSATTRNYKDAGGTGVCQACHAVPPAGGQYPAQHNLVTASANDCNGCHNHSATSAFGGGCSTCHGYPPPPAATGYVAVDETLSPHTSHAGGTQYNFGCTECHKGNSHNSGTFQDVFKNHTGILAGPIAGYDTGARGCSTVYCHSNGAGGYKAGQNPITWGTNKGSIIGQPGECNTCHDGTPATNRHTKHINKGYGCVNCHAATVSNNTTLLAAAKAANGTHVNNAKDISFSAYNGITISGSDCANIYCHSNGKGVYSSPVWTNAASGACGTCHATTPAIGGATLIGTNAHFEHFSTTYGPKLTQSTVAGCQNCHDYNSTQPDALHVNGTVNVGGVASQCATCHPGTLPTWTDPTRLACTSCHAATPSTIGGVPAPYKANFSSTGHGQSGVSYQCVTCHDNTSTHISGVAGDNKRLLSSLGSGSTIQECTYCHNDPAKVTNSARQNMSTHVLDKNSPTPTAGLCNACHDPHGTTNLSMIKVTINGRTIVFTNRSTGFISKTAVNGFYNGLCQVCHTQTTAFRNTTTSAASSPSSHYADRNCWQCHDHKGAYAFEPVGGGCNGCHGYPPVQSMAGLGIQNNYSTARLENYSGGGGAHNVAGHIPANATAGQAWTNCTVCHSTGTAQHAKGGVNPFKPSFVNVVVDPKYRFNPDLPITYSGNQVDPPARNATGSCSNVSCHFQPTPKWSTER